MVQMHLTQSSLEKKDFSLSLFPGKEMPPREMKNTFSRSIPFLLFRPIKTSLQKCLLPPSSADKQPILQAEREKGWKMTNSPSISPPFHTFGWRGEMARIKKAKRSEFSPESLWGTTVWVAQNRRGEEGPSKS